MGDHIHMKSASVFINKKKARKAGESALNIRVTDFRVQPFVKLHRDGSASNGYRVALFTRHGHFEGYVNAV
jgi:hypothetical protein